MRITKSQSLKVLLAGVVGAFGLIYAAGTALEASATTSALHVSQILKGTSLHHSYTPAGASASKTETLSNPDDITQLGNNLFVGFQNGVGPQGQASTDGNLDSTVVELNLTGYVLGQWDVVGKTDGVTADPQLGGVLATVNEDANSALYLIHPSMPSARAVTRYSYSEALPHNGGTDAISIDNGRIFISASAPGTTGGSAPSASFPAVYSVKLNSATKVAAVTPLFYDEASATIANHQGSSYNKSTKLALTDPDSNEVVPTNATRFAGDFMLTSQGDEEQIYLSGAGTTSQRLAVLNLTQSVDDTAWPSDQSGELYSTDSTNDAVDVVTGSFISNQPLVVATPCGANGSPATCPSGAKYPANYLATLNSSTGEVTKVALSGASYVPEGGLAFVK